MAIMHLSVDGAVALCGESVGWLFGGDEANIARITLTAFGPIVPPAWLRSRPHEGQCEACWAAVPAFRKQTTDEALTAIVGERPTDLDPPPERRPGGR